MLWISEDCEWAITSRAKKAQSGNRKEKRNLGEELSELRPFIDADKREYKYEDTLILNKEDNKLSMKDFKVALGTHIGPLLLYLP